MTADFKDNVKESNLIIPDNNGTEHTLTCTIIEFQDRVIINLAMDGKTDLSYDLQIPSLEDLKKPQRFYDYEEGEVPSNDFDEEPQLNSSISPTLLIGAGYSLKTQVLASQIGHVMSQYTAKNILLNMSGMMFGKPSMNERYHPNDSTVVKQAIHVIVDAFAGQS